MKLFAGCAELALTREDLMLILEEAINRKILSLAVTPQKVTGITLHPKNNYVIKITMTKKLFDKPNKE